MSQRLIAACLAVPAVLALIVFATVAKLPYATYAPGGTLDVLGNDENEAAIIQVEGRKTFRDDGELRMTTVSVSTPCADPDDCGLPLSRLLSAWIDGDESVYPYDAVHGEEDTPESSRAEGALQMATSQESAIEVALREMGIDVPQVLQVGAVTPDMPAEGTLQVGDTLLTVDGVKAVDDKRLRQLIADGEAGTPLEIGIERDGEKKTVRITPVQQDGRLLIGITPGYNYDFPFDVTINISPNIGGPSAGLIFSLAVYDTLTKGSLTGGYDVAGTGEIYPDGTVGPIGGIEQKIAGARDQGADLFLVPEANCADALDADNNGDMRLMRASTMHEVRLGLEQFAADVDAELPDCEDAA
ncbi:MAG: S16 family serine protease [Nocardioides sp.]